jgi:hypothetical protein
MRPSNTPKPFTISLSTGFQQKRDHEDHHTGSAIDIGSPGFLNFTQAFLLRQPAVKQVAAVHDFFHQINWDIVILVRGLEADA